MIKTKTVHAKATTVKKAAMFGLCRVLRKQSGRLFLTSSQSVGSKETRVEHQFKRAAMFGLDARIALAIFGALSVISGAALYSAIQNAKATALLADMQEIGKAWEQYYLDTGQDLNPIGPTSPDTEYRQTKDFVENPGVTGWKGPYLPYKVNTPWPVILEYRAADHIHIMNVDNSEWNVWANGVCVSKANCFVWINIDDTDGTYLSAFKRIDEMIDLGDGPTKGDVRYNWKNNDDNEIFLKYAPVF